MEELQAQIAALTAFIASVRVALGLPDDADEVAIAGGIATLRNESDEAKADLEDAQKTLADAGQQNIVLSERLDSSDERMTKLSQEVETLREEKNIREAEALITLAMQKGKLTAAEADGPDAPMRQIALTNRPLFQNIVDKRPAGNLTLTLSTDGDGDAEVSPDSFWTLVRETREKDPTLTSSQAQDLVTKAHPEYQVLFKAAAVTIAAEHAAGTRT